VSRQGAHGAQHLRFVLPLGAVAIMLLAAACSSSGAGGTSNASPSSSGGSQAATAKGTPYVIGNVGTYSGAYASSSAGAHDAINAWADYTNAHGGINGHPVKVIQMDDQLNSALALTQVKELVQQDHVMAIVGVSSVGTEDTWAPYIASGTTPVIGDLLAGDAMGKYKNFFPEGTAETTGFGYALPKIASILGNKRYGAIYCAETVACSAIADGQKQQAKAAGVSFVFSTAAATAATSYTAQCLAAKSADANAIALILPGQVAGEVAAACAQQGFTPQWLQGSNGFTEQETSVSALNGVAGPTADFPWFSSATPAMRQFQEAMHTYEPQDFSSTSYGYSEGAAMTWASAEIFEAAAKNLAPGQDTGADLIAQLYKLPKGDTFGGLTPPITYSASGLQPADTCFFEIQLKDGAYTALNGARPVCAS
jgi:branched-chain amino acid transport system substrate-binding protein